MRLHSRFNRGGEHLNGLVPCTDRERMKEARTNERADLDRPDRACRRFFVAGVAKLLAYKTLIKTIEEQRKAAPINMHQGAGCRCRSAGNRWSHWRHSSANVDSGCVGFRLPAGPDGCRMPCASHGRRGHLSHPAQGICRALDFRISACALRDCGALVPLGSTHVTWLAAQVTAPQPAVAWQPRLPAAPLRPHDRCRCRACRGANSSHPWRER